MNVLRIEKGCSCASFILGVVWKILKKNVSIINHEFLKIWQRVWWMVVWSRLFFTALVDVKMIV